MQFKVFPYEEIHDLQPIERIALVKPGIPLRIAAQVAQDMRVSIRRLFAIISVGSPYRQRLAIAKQALPLESSERLMGLIRLIGQVERIMKDSSPSCTKEGFKSAEWFGQWVAKPHSALGGRKPEEYVDTVDGRLVLSNLLSQMQSGVFA